LNFLLDASALLAVLLDETGAKRVIKDMRGATLSTVNFVECMTRAIDRGHAASDISEIIEQFEIVIAPFTPRHAELAAELRNATRKFGLSLGDRACLAVAIELQLPILTADQTWKRLDFNPGVDFHFIR
jgi:PIN domain nuclease of toxin-antitoxin system